MYTYNNFWEEKPKSFKYSIVDKHYIQNFINKTNKHEHFPYMYTPKMIMYIFSM